MLYAQHHRRGDLYTWTYVPCAHRSIARWICQEDSEVEIGNVDELKKQLKKAQDNARLCSDASHRAQVEAAVERERRYRFETEYSEMMGHYNEQHRNYEVLVTNEMEIAQRQHNEALIMISGDETGRRGSYHPYRGT